MLWEILWRNRNTFSLTFCLGFSLISLIWQRNPFAQLAGTVGKVADRVSFVLNSGLSLPSNLWVELGKYRELEKRLAVAQKQIEEYKLEKDKFDGLTRENGQLRTAMGFAPSREFPELKAEVLGVRLDSISPRILIGKGRQDGITPFMPVIAHAHDADQNTIRAVVGIVASVDSTTAVIEPIFHPGFRLGVRLPGTGEWAMLSGNSGSLTEVLLTYIRSDGSGDKSPDGKPLMVFTSGASGIFPKGIPVGTVTRDGTKGGNMRTAFVKPFAPVASLDYVIVIMKKPEAWKIRMDRDENWDENLSTEFGSATYTPEMETKPRIKRERLPGQEKRPEENPEKKPEKTEPETGPRRVQNVTPGN